MKIIKLEDETHAELMKCGSKGETFDKIVKKLIDIATKFEGLKKDNERINN